VPVLNLITTGVSEHIAERPQMLFVQASKLVTTSVSAAFPLTLMLAVPERTMAAPKVVIILRGVKDDGPTGATILIAAHAACLTGVAVSPINPA